MIMKQKKLWMLAAILILCGTNDKGPGERAIMEAAEDRALQMRYDERFR